MVSVMYGTGVQARDSAIGGVVVNALMLVYAAFWAVRRINLAVIIAGEQDCHALNECSC